MEIRELFEVVLPPSGVTLQMRIDSLLEKGVDVSVFASNFIPTCLNVTVEGPRRLEVAIFPGSAITAEMVSAGMRHDPEYDMALIEDLLAIVEDPRLIGDRQIIVCPGACFEMPGTESGLVTPFLDLNIEARENCLWLASDRTLFKPGVGFLLVKKG